MATTENKDKVKDIGSLNRQFQKEKLDESAYVEIHKSDGEMIGLIFHVGEFSLPILRSRPYQRIHDGIERNLLRPWVMGRATYKKKILLENPGRPGIVLKGVSDNLAGARHNSNDDLLSAAVWINGDCLNFSELFPEENRGYFYKEIVVTAVPVLEQSFQSGTLKVTTELILSSYGPVQRTTVEIEEWPSVELDYCFMSMFPKGVTEYHAQDNHGKPLKGNLEHPPEDNSTAEVTIPQAKWVATYNPDSQFGTLIYSPEFERAKMGHLLIADRRQGLKVYHVVGDCEHFAKLQSHAGSAKLTVSPGHPQQLALFARPIKANTGEWEARAEEEASQLIEMLLGLPTN
jgi:hypothetical protein